METAAEARDMEMNQLLRLKTGLPRPMDMDQSLRMGTGQPPTMVTGQKLRLEAGQLQEAGLPQAKGFLWEMAGKKITREPLGVLIGL